MLIPIFSFNSAAFSQNVIVLKSGEKMAGKAEQLKNDTLTFNFKGNKIQVNIADISALYFGEESPQIEQVPNSTQQKEKTQKGEISGVITYFFNDNFGDRPDIGAQVYVIDVRKSSDFNIASYDTFHYGGAYRNMYSSYKQMRKKIPDEIIENLKKWKVEDDELFEALDTRLTQSILKLTYSSFVIKSIVDGNGTYSLTVPPGEYYIFIKSNNRKGLSISEIQGKIYCKKISVKEGDRLNVSVNFDL